MPSEMSTASGDQLVGELRRELAEAREQQAATAGILAAISSARTSPDGIFKAIAATAAWLCGAYDTSIFERVAEGSEFARRLGHRSIVSVPLMRAGEAIGAISIRRAEVRPFSQFLRHEGRRGEGACLRLR